MGDRTNYCPSCKGYADRIAALEAENARLREAGNKLIADASPCGWCGASPDIGSPCDDEPCALYASIKAWREVTDQPQE